MYEYMYVIGCPLWSANGKKASNWAKGRGPSFGNLFSQSHEYSSVLFKRSKRRIVLIEFLGESVLVDDNVLSEVI